MWEKYEEKEENQRQITSYGKVILAKVVWEKLVNLFPTNAKATQTKNVLCQIIASAKDFVHTA